MTKPANLIFFLTDNHTRNMIGAAGHPVVKTPNLDRIAANGVRFTNAYCASALCCPSRAALATGRYPHQTGYWDNALAYDGGFPTWHGVIRDQGHVVTAIGKLHFVSEKNDNGFTEEILPMHIINGTGSLFTLLRATPEGVPQRTVHLQLYKDCGVGEVDYQVYDRQITKRAIEWLRKHGTELDQPWILVVSYPSPHPPFIVPQRFWDLYPLYEMPLPVQWDGDTRPDHPALAYNRRMNSYTEPLSEDFVRRMVAGYCGLVTHTDEQIGIVLTEAEDLGLMPTTRVLYTSDHGEAAGHHGLLGKANHYEHSVGIPLLLAGPGIPEGKVINQITSHVDLYPTVVESLGAMLEEKDDDLPGQSLWPAIGGREEQRIGFSEFHALSSTTASYMLRDGPMKLIYHVDMPNQLFDLAADPMETHDLLVDGTGTAKAAELEGKLLGILDPEEIDQRAKADQRNHIKRHGGVAAVRAGGTILNTPIPGKPAQVEQVSDGVYSSTSEK